MHAGMASVAVAALLMCAPFASANSPYFFAAPYHGSVGTFSYSHTGAKYYGYQYEAGTPLPERSRCRNRWTAETLRAGLDRPS